MERVKSEDLLIVKCQKNMMVADMKRYAKATVRNESEWRSGIAERRFIICCP